MQPRMSKLMSIQVTLRVVFGAGDSLAAGGWICEYFTGCVRFGLFDAAIDFLEPFSNGLPYKYLLSIFSEYFQKCLKQ